MTINQKQMAFAKKVYQMAKGREIHPIFITAQAVLETGWGAHIIGENNIFGITKGSWKGPIDKIETTEYFNHDRKTLSPPDKILRKLKLTFVRWQYRVIRAFRHYNTLEECLVDYINIFKKPMYKEAWEYKDNPLMFALKVTNIHRAKYATSPDYYKSLRTLIIILREKETWLNKEEENESN